ncbi:hypothetical protein TOPH_08417 [Tolypocladium ophioglossoides CBS 100239]|uniref:Arylsulfotransferase n=1 Tax=Tolypocladium ophioglossoides (strain CBS 100239) TaxID=1163406 RepID=A0A0L0MYQ1_TOLOC|nr:hypothetical protein TOPH_08417 [Tolypocladium ophioglossoides CBS 100239]
MGHRMALLGLLLIGTACLQHGAEASSEPYFEASTWYDWGLHGACPRQSYQSFGGRSPKLNLARRDSRCHDGLVFLEPRGVYVDMPGPVIVDNEGNLVWLPTLWGEAMDVKVQRFNGSNYITFRHRTDSGTFGEAGYIMLDESYEVFRQITPVGGVKGDLHGFQITQDGTALITIYQETQTPTSSDGLPTSWIYDSIFQEIDLHSGELLFEWHTSDYFPVDESRADDGQGDGASKAFDFFHINSIDKGADGNYLVSSRYMRAVACISREDGRVLWQLGGDNNDFEDLSHGGATNFTWKHHASWYENTTLTLFDNDSNSERSTAEHSRGLMIELDLEGMTAALVHSHTWPQKLLAPSQGSVQVLPNSNVLVGWSHTPAYTEFSLDGEVLCDTHLGRVWFADRGWVKSYRAFKSNWVGRPNTVPDVAVRPTEQAMYVSWNGATEVDVWVLQSGPSPDFGVFVEHKTAAKTTFETRISVPSNANEFVRVVALDASRRVLAYSNIVSRHIRTVTEPLCAPLPREAMPDPAMLLALAFCGLAAGIAVVYRVRGVCRRGLLGLWRTAAPSCRHQPLPRSEKQWPPPTQKGLGLKRDWMF